jgi:hypothetical protein
MRIFIVLTVIILLSSTQLFAEKMRIAIMDFTADGVTKQEARRITELIRTEIINTGKFTVIERDQMDKILQEQGFQQTGCTDESCAVKIGRLASANKMLVGTVMAVGTTMVINGRIVDVEKGIAEFGERQIARNSGEIYDTAVAFSQKLTKRIYKDAKGMEYHSPVAAGAISLAPFWSGSMSNGFDALGMTFIIAKSLTLICGVLSVLQVWPIDAVNMEYYFAAYGAITIGDVIYSSIAVARFNEKYGLSASIGNNSVSIALRARESSQHNPLQRYARHDGINLAAVYRF